MRAIAALTAIVCLVGCELDSREERPAATALPKKICDDAKAAVNEATKGGAVILNSPVEAVISQEAWLPLPEAQRDGLTRAMGIAATCAGGTPRHEQEVVIRSETGTVLTRRVIETSFSLPDS